MATFNGTAGNNTIVGSILKDLINGLGGNDTLSGGKGNDKIDGGNGHDTLDGGAGNDRLYGRNGDDRMLGGLGNDLMYGGQGDDFARGGADNDTVYGELGNDRIFGDAGDDYLYGGLGNDKVIGGAGNDFLRGTGDTLNGNGTGEYDELTGGTGADTFSLLDSVGNQAYLNDDVLDGAKTSGYALIKDFNPTQGDIIQLDGFSSWFQIVPVFWGQQFGQANTDTVVDAALVYVGPEQDKQDVVAVFQDVPSLIVQSPNVYLQNPSVFQFTG